MQTRKTWDWKVLLLKERSNLSLFKATGIHEVDSGGVGRFTRPGSADPYRWGPIWNRISELLETGGAPEFCRNCWMIWQRLPMALRAAPALLLIAAYILAYRDSIAIMERNTFQPDLTISHFMRLAKNPRNIRTQVPAGE